MHFVITKHSDGDDQDLDAVPVDAINDPSLPGANTLASYPPPIKRFTRPARLSMDDARFDDSKNCRRFYTPEADQNAGAGGIGLFIAIASVMVLTTKFARPEVP